MKKIALTFVACFSMFWGIAAYAQDTVTTEPVVPEQVVTPPVPEAPQKTVTTVVPAARDAITNEVVAPEQEKPQGKKSLRDEVRGKMK